MAETSAARLSAINPAIAAAQVGRGTRMAIYSFLQENEKGVGSPCRSKAMAPSFNVSRASEPPKPVTTAVPGLTRARIERLQSELMQDPGRAVSPFLSIVRLPSPASVSYNRP